ncbi:MAG: hypothetical protein AB8B93_09795 [Pseudomonadales bacterium]
MTAPLRSVGDGFFEAWGSGQPQQAYPYLGQAFKAGTSAEQLHRFMTQARLNQKIETSWSKSSVNNNVGHLFGAITRPDGSKISVDVNLMKEAGLWKISTIHLTTPTPTLPNVAHSNGYAPAGQQSPDSWSQARPGTRSGGSPGPTDPVQGVASVVLGQGLSAPD